MKLQLKRSNVLDGGKAKEPTASFVEYGELCVNYNSDDPALFIKDSDDNIIRIAGAESISTDGDGATGAIGYWNRSGTTLKPVNSGDSVYISGVGSINLNQNGVGVFSSKVSAGTDPYDGAGEGAAIAAGGNVRAGKTEPTAAVWYGYTAGTTKGTSLIRANGEAEFQGAVKIGGNLPSNPNISLNGSNGNGTFAGNVGIGTTTVNANLQINGIKGDAPGDNHFIQFSTSDVPLWGFRSDINNNYLTLDRKWQAGSNWQSTVSIDRNNGNVLIGGTLPSAPNISLGADGVGYMSKLGLGYQKNPSWSLDVQSDAAGHARFINPTNDLSLRIQPGDAKKGAIQFGNAAGFVSATLDYSKFDYDTGTKTFAFSYVNAGGGQSTPVVIDKDGLYVTNTVPANKNISLNTEGELKVGSVAQNASTNCIANKTGSNYPLQLKTSGTACFLIFDHSGISNPYHHSIGFANQDFRISIDNNNRFITTSAGAFYFGDNLNLGENPEGYKFGIKVDGSSEFKGKVQSVSTEASDPDSTLTTKDYVDALVGAGGTTYWERDDASSTLSTATANDNVNIDGNLYAENYRIDLLAELV